MYYRLERNHQRKRSRSTKLTPTLIRVFILAYFDLGRSLYPSMSELRWRFLKPRLRRKKVPFQSTLFCGLGTSYSLVYR